MKSALVEIQPTERGDEISWWFFHRGKFHRARYLERKLGLTVFLTDAITVILNICKSIDPQCEVTIFYRNGLLFPNFIIKIISDRFQLEAEKKFAGGASRENAFNYKVTVTIFSKTAEIITLILKNYRKTGPRPLFMSVNL